MNRTKGKKSRANDLLPDQPTHQKGFRLSRGDKQFWLGHQKQEAELKARSLDLAWQKIKSAQRDKWTDDEVRAALENAQITPKPTPAPQPALRLAVTPEPLPPKPQIGGLTLHQALDQYRTIQEGRNDLEDSAKSVIISSLKSMKSHLPDDPLSEIGTDRIGEYRQLITSRPLSMRRLADSKQATRRNTPGQQTEAKPISISTVAEWLTKLKHTLNWCRKTARWKLPEGLDRIEFDEMFALSASQKRKLRIGDEVSHSGKTKPTPTLDEIKVYYKAATPGQRLYMLIGILLGWRQTQIAALKKDELLVENKQHFIRTMRTKTDEPINVWVGPELADLLIARIKSTPANSDNLAFLTHNGMSLVNMSGARNRTDIIGASWGGLMRRMAKMGMPRFPFDSLRRFAGQCVMNEGEPYLAQVFLAHKPNTVLEQHYTNRAHQTGVGKSPVARVHETQQKVYETLKVLFDEALSLNDMVKAYKEARQVTEQAA